MDRGPALALLDQRGNGTGVQGEETCDDPTPIVIHFEETPEGLKWHWFCCGEKDGRPCGAKPSRYAATYEQWIGEQARWNWPDHSVPLVVRLG